MILQSAGRDAHGNQLWRQLKVGIRPLGVPAQAEAITAYAALLCTTCAHPSSHHSDIGTCEVCDCATFEEG